MSALRLATVTLVRAVLIVGLLMSCSAPCFAQLAAERLWLSDRDSNVLYEIDLDTFDPIAMHVIDIPGSPIDGIPGIAWDPNSERFYLLIDFELPLGSAPFLVRYDPVTSGIEFLGSTLYEFDGLAVSGSGFPLSVTRSDALPSATLCELSAANGVPTEVCSYLNPNQFHSIAIDPTTDDVYHVGVGSSSALAQLIGSTSGVCSNDFVPLDPVLLNSFVMKITWSPYHDALLWHRPDGYYTVDPSTGAATFLGDLPSGFPYIVSSAMAVGPSVGPPVPFPGVEFQRGDVNVDGSADVADVIFTLGYLFIVGAPTPDCLDAADVVDDGLINIADAVTLINFLFVPGAPPPEAPSPGDCGVDPTPDFLDCQVFGCP